MEYQISIIVPVYNAEAYVLDALGSLEQQTLGFSHLQVLLVNDHSTDGSAALLAEWAAGKPNVTLLEMPGPAPSGGAAWPRNYALPHVQAPYVMFLDNDDFFAPDGCAALYRAAERSGADLVMGYYRETAMDKTPLQEKQHWCGTLTQDTLFQLPQDMPGVMEVVGLFWCKLYRTAIIKEHQLQFPPLIHTEDTIFFLRYLRCCKTALYTDQLVYNFRLRDTSVSHTMGVAYLRTTTEGYDYIFDLLVDQPACLLQVMDSVARHFLAEIFLTDALTDAERRALLPNWTRIARYSVEHDLMPHDEYALPRLIHLVADEQYDAAYEVGKCYEEYYNAVITRDKHFLDSEKIWNSVADAAKAEAAAARAELEAVRASRTYRFAQRLSRLLHPGK